MTSEADLKRLMKAAIADPRAEPALLRALLTADLFALLPRSDDSGRIRFLMFNRRDGVAVIPFFSDEAKACVAAGSAARVAQVGGGELLHATRGATLMLDPNDTSTTLYPEEVAALLDEGRGVIAPVAADAPDLELIPLERGDLWLVDHLAHALESVQSARRLHLARARPVGSPDEPDRYLAIVAVTPPAGERVARALAVALYAAAREPGLPLDLSTYDGDVPAAEITGLNCATTRDLHCPRDRADAG